jgi:glycosyltransferase involved in cell wall biosynthesis
MIVSVIITTKNEEKNIGNCLKSIKEQDYPQNLIEIIVVDNNSTDKTKDIALTYTDQVFDRTGKICTKKFRRGEVPRNVFLVS